jgi:hypothetical protein
LWNVHVSYAGLPVFGVRHDAVVEAARTGVFTKESLDTVWNE